VPCLRDHSLVFHALEPSVCVMRVGSGSEGSLDVCDGARARREGDEGLSVTHNVSQAKRREGLSRFEGLSVTHNVHDKEKIVNLKSRVPFISAMRVPFISAKT